MAISRMKKLSVIAPKSAARKLMKQLQKLSCVEIMRSPSLSPDTENNPPPKKLTDRIAAIEAKLATIRRAVAFLTEYTEAKKIYLEPPEINIDDFDAGLDIITFEEVGQTLQLEAKISAQRDVLSTLKAEIASLIPWKSVDASLPESRTAKTISYYGSFPANFDFAALTEKLGDLAYVVSLISEDKLTKNVVVTSHRSDAEDVRKIVFAAGFAKCTAKVTEAEGLAAGKLKELREKYAAEKKKMAALRKEAIVQSEKLMDFKALCDVYETRLERLRARLLSTETAKTTIICGWVPQRAVKAVEEKLNELGCAYSLEDPSDDDDVPILLYNRAPASYFESVLSMYSLPAYGTFDPTMIMSFFYALIFGLMFADVGYGLIVLFGCLAMLKFMHPAEGMKRMLQMFMCCSLSCILFGALFGGYFGDLPQAILTNFMGRENVGSTALWFDLLDNPIMFFIIALAVGVIHIVCGLLIKFYVLCRDGHVFAAFADVGSWIVVFAGIGLIFINQQIGMITAGVGAVALILTQGRNEKNIIMKLAKGVMSLYDIISYGSDIVSYSRILALGLSSAVIAKVVNILSTLMGFSLPGILMFIFIFLIGHSINMALNLLSTYIHTGRLQYLEFFSKFYETGGREFSPLKYKSNYVNLK